MRANDFGRWILPIQRKINFLVARTILKFVDNTKTKTQVIQTQGIRGGENDGGNSDIERLQPYGFETYPYADDVSECVNLNIAGLRERAINILVHNRDLRPTDLEEGESCLYSKDSSNSNTNRITIRPTDEIEIKTKDDQSIVLNSTGIVITDTKNSNTITLDSTGTVIEDGNNNKITFSSSGIKLENATVNIELGAASVKVNGTALEVLP